MASLIPAIDTLNAEIQKLKASLRALEKATDDMTSPAARGADKNIARLNSSVNGLSRDVNALLNAIDDIVLEVDGLRL